MRQFLNYELAFCYDNIEEFFTSKPINNSIVQPITGICDQKLAPYIKKFSKSTSKNIMLRDIVNLKL